MIHIGEVLHQPIETLSKGYKRRVGVAQALAFLGGRGSRRRLRPAGRAA
jgi:hypothetical protein